MINISPIPGWILVKPHIFKDQVFISEKENQGDCQISEIIAIGSDLTDDNGLERVSHCDIGDIIIHHYSQDDFIIKNEKFRFVHFSNVRGVYEP